MDHQSRPFVPEEAQVLLDFKLCNHLEHQVTGIESREFLYHPIISHKNFKQKDTFFHMSVHSLEAGSFGGIFYLIF